jgi:hypothetical protein
MIDIVFDTKLVEVADIHAIDFDRHVVGNEVDVTIPFDTIDRETGIPDRFGNLLGASRLGHSSLPDDYILHGRRRLVNIFFAIVGFSRPDNFHSEERRTQ